MKRIQFTLALLAAALLFIGCAPSLHPYATEETAVFNKFLLGEWLTDSGDRCVFKQTGEKQYEVLFEDDKPARYAARLFELGGGTYLDLSPETEQAGTIRGHLLLRVTIAENELSMAMLEEGWLRKLSDQRELTLPHERLSDGTIILTAPTAELQAFLLRHAAHPSLFADPEVYRRAPARNYSIFQMDVQVN